jgi:peptidoglycan hydrolase-like protein with peptidoglycan-binding domain
MIKTHYTKELSISAPCEKKMTNEETDVLKIQSWLNLFALNHPDAGTASGIDGDFGPGTEKAVINFQKFNNLEITGSVDNKVFEELTAPLKKAFSPLPNMNNLRDQIVTTANAHLQQRPFELDISHQTNSGPWVRSYMDGHEGTDWFWCVGFAQSIIDQAASSQNKDFRSLIPLTYSCDVVALRGQEKNALIPNSDIRSNPSLAKPGDLFLLQRSPTDWHHIGIVIDVDKDVFSTIEGNTNTDGSFNGNGVYARTRNFRKQVLDILSIQSLV